MKYKTFLINLDRSQDRLKKAAEQLQQAGIGFERVPAVDGKQLDQQTIDDAFNAQTAKRRFPYDLTIGEIGCYLSHVKCWQKIVDEGLDYAVILEDDLLVKDNLSQVIASVPTIKLDWDYLKLAAPFKQRAYKSLQRLSKDNQPVELVEYTKKSPTGTVAQIVSRKGAERLLAIRPPFFRPVDVDLQWQHELGIKVFGLVPYPIENADSPSEIQKLASRKTVKKRPGIKLKEMIRYQLKI
ncbi:MAG: glycosyltransferase family 25 protein [Pseudomonadota bacterium]